MEKRVENRSKRKLDIDWGQVLQERNDDPPVELIVEKDGPPRAASNAYSDDSASEKLLREIKRLEDERQRRRLLRPEMVCLDVDGCEKPTQSLISGASDTYRQGTASSQFQSQSSFASAFTEKMEENNNCRAFDKELSTLAPCERWKIKSDEELSHGRAPSTYLPHHAIENISSSFPNTKDESQSLPSNKSRQRKERTLTIEQEDKLDERMKGVTIYYPSRDDPESVEIVTQISSRAVSYKGVDKNSFFIKFRRWWKGVNIFHKAYVLIPIHEESSLELGDYFYPKQGRIRTNYTSFGFTGLHSSRSIFNNIRSFLKEEWNYLNEEVSPSDLPIADRIWKHLPRRIDERIITVPQQKKIMIVVSLYFSSWSDSLKRPQKG
ncbi:hypothetical protein LWI28_020081 [Acer negundo]|uniref:Uncharacterized protein n=1 Tax=Acer negundo TaxID=4023 RepID=A0AAD5IN50_ACENE|nr:hypothetical protein LWI28_020081 [Acer negundo]